MSSPSKEKFTIRPLLPSQAGEVLAIEGAAGGTSALAQLFFAGAPKNPETGETNDADKIAELREKRRKKHVEEIVEQLKNPEVVYHTVTCAQADDSELLEHGSQQEEDGNELATKDEKIIAYAYWQYHKGRSEEEWKTLWETRKERRPEGIYHELVDATGGQRTLKRAKIIGSSDYYSLEGLYVLPAYQRRGIGGMLVEAGVKRADELGWLLYIEATNKGDGLYRKYGFEEKDRVSVDLGDWGGEKGVIDTYTLLVRPAKKG